MGTSPEKVRFVHARATGSGKPRVLSHGEANWRGDAASLGRAYREFGLDRTVRCATLLVSGEYQISVVAAPDVPETELRAAMRWRLKEVVDYPVEQAVFDLLEIPAPVGSAAPARRIYVIAARSDVVKSCMARFDAAKVPLQIIDIPETAQRNVSALYEKDGRGVGLLYFDDAGGLLTVTCGTELFLARRFDFTMTQIRQSNEAYRENLYDRILVELQRTLDNFERQYNQIALSRIMFGPQPEPTPLGGYLRSNLGLEVVETALEDVLDFSGAVPDAKTQWAYFHLIGCAIRSEGNPA